MIASIFSSITSPPWGSFWFSVEAICILVVAFGCGAEVWADLHKFSDKFRIDPKSGRLGEKTLGAQRKEWWKIFFGIIVAMGLAVEVMAFSFSFLTSSREIEELHKSNLVLQAKLKTRIITEDERKYFIECLRGQPRGKVMVSFDRGASANVRVYAGEIAELLIAAGYSVPGGADICDVKPILPPDTSIEVWTKSLNDGPAYFYPLANCLTKVADKVVPNVNSDILWISTNELWIYIANYR